MLKSLFYTGLACTLILPLTASAQSRATNTDKNQPSFNLKAQKSDKTVEAFACHLKGVQMTAEGLGYFCVHKSGSVFTDYLVVSKDGNSAGMELLISIANAKKGAKAMVANRVKAADKKAQRICDLIQGPSGRRNNVKCREAISFGWSLSSGIQTGSAQPGPNIPTADANPNGPNIPTRPARPD